MASRGSLEPYNRAPNLQALLSDASCLRGRDATSAIERKIKKRMRCVQSNKRSICEHRISLCDDCLGTINLFILCYIILLYYIVLLCHYIIMYYILLHITYYIICIHSIFM